MNPFENQKRLTGLVARREEVLQELSNLNAEIARLAMNGSDGGPALTEPPPKRGRPGRGEHRYSLADAIIEAISVDGGRPKTFAEIQDLLEANPRHRTTSKRPSNMYQVQLAKLRDRGVLKFVDGKYSFKRENGSG